MKATRPRADSLLVWMVAALGWASATGWLFQLLPWPVAGILSLGAGMLLARAADARVRRVRQERWKAEVRASRTAQRQDP
jgi:membrane protein implicated in regulation of membrane protease activity